MWRSGRDIVERTKQTKRRNTDNAIWGNAEISYREKKKVGEEIRKSVEKVREKMTREELDKVLENHQHWLREDVEGWQNMRANLGGADLWGANLGGAELLGAENVPFIPMTCPDTGAFVAWKQCQTSDSLVIVKLLIPEDAKRSSGTGRKCRADKAVVLEIQDMAGEALEGVVARSSYDPLFTYEVGKTVEPREPFDDCRWNECGSGIHFFINRQEAVNY